MAHPGMRRGAPKPGAPLGSASSVVACAAAGAAATSCCRAASAASMRFCSLARGADCAEARLELLVQLSLGAGARCWGAGVARASPSAVAGAMSAKFWGDFVNSLCTADFGELRLGFGRFLAAVDESESVSANVGRVWPILAETRQLLGDIGNLWRGCGQS